MATALLTNSRGISSRVRQIVNIRIPELDGLRGCAILLVLLFHCGTFNATNWQARLLRLGTGVSLGWSGVDLFFVLSGFLITGILLETKGCFNYFSSFYARRVLRIFPLYMAFVLIFFWIALPIAHAFGHGMEIKYSAQIWYWLYVSNWRVGLGLTHEDYLNHFWSLAIEEQFYLIWPLVVSLISERLLLRLCGVIIVGCLALRTSLVHLLPAAAINFLTPFRIDTLAFGAVVCLLFRNADWLARYRRQNTRVLWAASLGLIILVVFCGAVSVEHIAVRTIGYTLFAAFYASLVFGAAASSGAAGSFVTVLRSRFLRTFGKYSYGIYVIHMPVYIIVRHLLNRLSEHWHRDYNAPFAFLCVVACSLISYGLARVSWKLLEQPFLRMKERFPYCLDSNIEPNTNRSSG